MALAFGVVIAGPLVLTVFSSAVNAEYRQECSLARAVRQSTWDKCNPVPPATTPPGVNCADFRLALADTVGAADQKLRDAQAQLAVAQQNFTAVRTQYEKMQDAAEVAKYDVLTAFGRRLATFDREHDSSTATFVQDG